MKTVLSTANNLIIVAIGVHYDSPFIIMIGITIILAYIAYEVRKLRKLNLQREKEKSDWLNRNSTKIK